MERTEALLKEWKRRETQGPEEKERPVCPNCDVPLPKSPKRKTTCPVCCKPIVVRRGILCSESQGVLLSWFERLECFGAAPDLVLLVEAELQRKFGQAPSTRDIIWGVMNRLVTKDDIQNLRSQLYQEMGRLVLEEGRDPKPYQEQAAILDLLFLRETGCKKVWIFGVSDERQCQACATLSEKTITLDEALGELPVPRKCTSREGCRCVYMAKMRGYGFES